MADKGQQDSADANPYRPPATESIVEVTLDPDSEFLISQSEILCRETVELPRVCIHTGISDNLVKQTHRYLPNTGARNIMRVLFWLGVITAGPSLALACSPAQLFAMVLSILVLKFGLRRLAWHKLFSTHLTATWYVS